MVERPQGSLAAAQAVTGDQQSAILARGITSRVPTLVKDVRGILPLSLDKHRRVLVFSGGVMLPFVPTPLPLSVPDRLTAEGFEVTVYQPGMAVSPRDYDLVLYLFAEETLLTRSRIFLDWHRMTGSVFGAMARYWHDLPTLMISFGWPYYLHDAPRVPAYVNAYGSSEALQAAAVEAILGRQAFAGTSPVDPFVGSEQGRY